MRYRDYDDVFNNWENTEENIRKGGGGMILTYEDYLRALRTVELDEKNKAAAALHEFRNKYPERVEEYNARMRTQFLKQYEKNH